MKGVLAVEQAINDMIAELQNREPQGVLRHFSAICAIPHGSYHEEKIADMLVDFAKAHGLWYYRDAMHNVLIKKAATEGYENEPTVLLQGHTDMVCVKRASSTHDFENDALQLRVEDGWLSATDTTLGADDGIAVAMMLAILESTDIPHPALECLFTVQEEVGLGGAAGFDYSHMEAKLLYNLDSEDEGVGTVSCAGGIRCDITKKVTFATEQTPYITLSVTGFKGGHSGAEIHLSRGSAHRVVGHMLARIAEKFEIRISSLTGGEMDNAIPRDCSAVFAYRREDEAALYACLDTVISEQMAVLSADDRVSGKIVYEKGVGDICVTDTKTTGELLSLLLLTPNGVFSICEDMPALVESSCNMGVLQTSEGAVTFGFLARSSVETKKEDIRVRLALCAAQCGAEVEYSGAYPGWAYDKSSEAEARYVKAYEMLYGKRPRVEAIHAGLECGLIKHALPHIGAISIGPNMRDIHTPDERIELDSIARVYKTVLSMLAIKGR